MEYENDTSLQSNKLPVLSAYFIEWQYYELYTSWELPASVSILVPVSAKWRLHCSCYWVRFISWVDLLSVMIVSLCAGTASDPVCLCSCTHCAWQTDAKHLHKVPANVVGLTSFTAITITPILNVLLIIPTKRIIMVTKTFIFRYNPVQNAEITQQAELNCQYVWITKHDILPMLATEHWIVVRQVH